ERGLICDGSIADPPLERAVRGPTYRASLIEGRGPDGFVQLIVVDPHAVSLRDAGLQAELGSRREVKLAGLRVGVSRGAALVPRGAICYIERHRSDAWPCGARSSLRSWRNW